MALAAAKNILTKFDHHGQPIALTYQNKPTYQTSIGGAVTIISRLGVLAFFMVLVSNIVNREKVVTFKTIYKSANDDNQTNPVDLTNFDIGFGLTFYDGLAHLYEKQNIEKYFNVQFTSFLFDFVEVNGTKVVKRTLQNIPYKQCKLGRFAGKDSDMIQIGMDQPGWYCIDDMDFDLIGQVWSVRRSTLRLRMQTCTNSTTSNVTCASQEDIDALMKISVLQLAMLQSTFDQDKFDSSPIKHDIIIIPLNYKSDQSFALGINLQKNRLKTRDFWASSLLNNNDYDFFKIIIGQISVGVIRPNINDMLTIQVYNHQEETVIERKVTTLIDILPLAGGFTNIILLVTKLISKLYSKPLLDQQIISHLYSKTSKSRKSTNSKFADIENSQELNKQQIFETLQRSLQQKKPLVINTFRIACNQFLSSFKCKKTKVKDYDAFREFALAKVNKKFDIIYIVRSIRKIKTGLKLLMKDHQYALIPFMQQNYLNPKATNQIQIKSRKTSKNLKTSVENYNKVFLEQSLKNCIKSKEKISLHILNDLLEVAGLDSKRHENKSHSKQNNAEETKQTHRENLENSQRPLNLEPPIQLGTSKKRGNKGRKQLKIDMNSDSVVPFDN